MVLVDRVVKMNAFEKNNTITNFGYGPWNTFDGILAVSFL